MRTTQLLINTDLTLERAADLVRHISDSNVEDSEEAAADLFWHFVTHFDIEQNEKAQRLFAEMSGLTDGIDTI